MGEEATPAADFSSRLRTERDALQAFITLLETERETLTAGHIEQLLELVNSKTQAAQELNKLESARRSDLIACGVAIGADSIESWLKTQAQDQLPLWREILRLAEQAKQLNHTNGALIQTRLRHNQQMLTALHNAANSVHGLYGPDGQPHITSSGRTLGSV